MANEKHDKMRALKVQNFQRHSSFTIKFSPYVNSVVGESDSGKSALFRAIRWLTFNKPAGSAFVQWHKKFTRVALKIAEHTVGREKGKRNLYVLDGEKLASFKTSPPQEVTDVLNLHEICFQSQHDPPFWFNESPGEVSRQLNAIVGLDIIDKTSSYLSSVSRKSKIEKEIVEERLKSAQEEKKAYSFVKRMSRDFDKVNALHKKKRRLLSQMKDVESSIKRVEEIKSELSRLKPVVQSMDKVAGKGAKVLRLFRRVKTLSFCVHSIEEIKRTLEIDVPDVSSLTSLFHDWQDIKFQYQSLSNLISNIKNAKDELCDATQSAQKAKDLLQKKIGKNCPLCGGQIKSSPSE